jgi:hypothetical protein
MNDPVRVLLAAAAVALGGLVVPASAVADPGSTAVPPGRSAKEANDPLPPAAMPRPAGPDVPTPRGTPEGMGNEVDLSKTPGDDDPSDGVDEPGRNPVPGQPREAPGVNKP